MAFQVRQRLFGRWQIIRRKLALKEAIEFVKACPLRRELTIVNEEHDERNTPCV
jgi:hypothetical protein